MEVESPKKETSKGREEIYQDTTHENTFQMKHGLSLCDEEAQHGTCSSCQNVPGWSLTFHHKEKPPLGGHAQKGRHGEEISDVFIVTLKKRQS